MTGIQTKSLDAPDETRTPARARIDVVHVDNATVARMVLEPGWRWSESIGPVTGTERCQVHHLGVLVGGRLHVVHGDGSEADLAPGAIYEIQPGHDAWVVGDEPVVGFEFDSTTAERFGKK